MITLTLAGRAFLLTEPVFRQLKAILPAYNRLACDCTAAEQLEALDTLLATLTDGAVKLSKINETEWPAFLQAIPALCHFETKSGNGEAGEPIDWGGLYGHLSATFGWTYDYIDNHMTLTRLDEYRAYFKKNPATHYLVAAYLDYAPTEQQSGAEFLAALAARVKHQGVE